MKKLLLALLALLSLALPAWAEETGRTVILPEGTTDIPREAYAHNTVITDLYLPASLQTVHGEPLTRSWSFSLVYGGNNWHSQEYKLVLHAPAATDAAQFAQRSGLPYVIEDARGGTDRAAVADWVQSALDGQFPGARVCENRIGLPAVAYSADTVLAAIRLPDGMLTLCLFDRTGDALTLRWRNDELLSQAQEQTWTNEGARWTGGYVPHEMWLRGDTLSLAVQLRENLTLSADFHRRDGIWTLTEMRLLEDNGVYWHTPVILRLTEDMLAPGIDLAYWAPIVWGEGDE